jgi:hypothetical protein
MTKRREFTRAQKEAIVERAMIDGVVHCERCGLALKKGAYEIDHRIAEALRPDADKQVKLTLADGQLLGFCCHRGPDGKTNDDIKKIAKARRQSAKDKGITAPKQKIAAKGFPKREKPARADKPMPPRRSFYVPAGSVYAPPTYSEERANERD